MVVNKKSQLLILKLMVAIIIFIIALIMIVPLKETISTATNSTELNCSSDLISNEMKATCTTLDFSLFYILGAAISVGMAYIAGRKTINGTITAIVIFVVTTILIEPLKTLIILARDSSHLNCGAVGNSVAVNMSCILVNLWLFWLIAATLAAAFTFIFVKVTD
jgi:hypothetical protein